MLTYRNVLLGGVLGFVAFSSQAHATPLSLYYTVADNKGVYTYNFELELTNSDHSWKTGQYFNWITYGDVAGGPTVLKNFVPNSKKEPTVGPFQYALSLGGHTGPSLLDLANIHGWTPTAVGQYLTWSGTSSAYVAQGALKFSNVIGNGVAANFTVANLVTALPYQTPPLTPKTLFSPFSPEISAVPLPGALPMFGAALLGLAGLGGRKRGRKLVA